LKLYKSMGYEVRGPRPGRGWEGEVRLHMCRSGRRDVSDLGSLVCDFPLRGTESWLAMALVLRHLMVPKNSCCNCKGGMDTCCNRQLLFSHERENQRRLLKG
jgi:hypothetical protein